MITFRQPFVGDYQVTQWFGETVTDKKGHSGIDFDCPAGTEILASAAGTVRFAGWDPTGYGFCVIIQHSADRSTLYAHLSKILVRVLQQVDQAAVIGLSGYSGNVVPEGPAGRHLHFEARTQWNRYFSAFDPLELPLQSVEDWTAAQSAEFTKPEQLGKIVEVVAPAGAKRFKPDWSLPDPPYFNRGTKLHYTGRTAKRPGYDYTYCEVYEEPQKFWVAIHNEDTQILDNTE